MFPVTAFHILCSNINLGLPRSRMLRVPDPRVNEMKVLDLRRGFETVAGETVVIDMVIVFLAQFNGLVSGKIYGLSLSPYLSIHPCTWQSTNQSIYLSTCLPIYLSIYPSIYLSIYVWICPSIYPSTYFFPIRSLSAPTIPSHHLLKTTGRLLMLGCPVLELLLHVCKRAHMLQVVYLYSCVHVHLGL